MKFRWNLEQNLEQNLDINIDKFRNQQYYLDEFRQNLDEV